jgi:hypothetical protein
MLCCPGRVALCYQRTDPGNEFTAVFHCVVAANTLPSTHRDA